MERMGTYREISEYDPYEVLDLCEALDVWADINDGLGAAQSGRAAYDSVLDSCLATYGWSQ